MWVSLVVAFACLSVYETQAYRFGLLGGYSQPECPTDEQQKMFSSMIQQSGQENGLSELDGSSTVDVLQVEMQIVQGSNYRGLVRVNDNDCYTVVIHEDLPNQYGSDGPYSILGVNEAECSPEIDC
uniref:Cystatin 3 n=1 Tax=Opisthorchis viverrini TaxID=6198 RepID=A0AA96MI70_OPIVI|nr:cystatin 3 [Opisthorchis viverrini]